MNDQERWEQNHAEHAEYKERLKVLEDRMAQHDLQYAVINTKLTAILWGVGVIGTALIGVLVKIVFNV